MLIRLRFFASVRERLRRAEGEKTLSAGATVADLWASLVQDHPEIEPLGGAMSFAVNQEYAERDHVLSEGDEVALIPPVSGG